MHLLNHSVIVVKPKIALKHWLEKIALSQGVFPVVVKKANLEDLQIDNPVFITPYLTSVAEFDSYFDQYSNEIFHTVLSGWCEDEALWPEDRSQQKFAELFSVELHGMLFSSINDQKNEVFASVLKPKQPLIDWIEQLATKDNNAYLQELLQKQHDMINSENTILIPAENSLHKVESYFQHHCDEIFTSQLSIWSNQQQEWPVTRDLKKFTDWFDVDLHTEVVKLL